ncbi:MAG TPA: MerR family transcriptional regulator [Polyangia bacterium]
MNATEQHAPLRIGELAELVGTTPRTIRYYEEIGLLPRSAEHVKGKHRVYDAAAVERLRELMRLRDLLGLSLEELRTLVEAEEARAAIRREFHQTESVPERRRLVAQALGHVETQLALVRKRQAALAELEAELAERERRLKRRRTELG